jgi:integrase
MALIGHDLMNSDLAVVPVVGPLMKRLAEWSNAAQGAFAPNTERALRSDSRAFTAWCSASAVAPLPASSETVATYLRVLAAQGKAVATIRRRATTIAQMHRAAGVISPCDTDAVRLALKAIARERGTQQRQATPLTGRDANRIADRVLGGDGTRLKDIRDVALMWVGKDLLARASELVALTVDAVSFDADGTAHVAVHRRKTSTEAQVCLLGPDATARLREWLGRGGISSGAIFRSISKRGIVSAKALDVRDVGRILKGLARRVSQMDVSGISSHSLRVGTAVDCVTANIDVAAIMQAGGWSTVRMIARYTSKLAAKRGAIARLHKLTG